MKMNLKNYEALASEAVKKLGNSIKHQDEGECPSCGHCGRFDLLGAEMNYTSIFYDTNNGQWVCPACGLY